MPGGGSRAAWAPSQGSWGASLGGVPGPKSESQSLVSPLGFCIEIDVDFDVALSSFWGSILGPSWGSLSLLLPLFSTQVGPRTVFGPSYLRKNDFVRNITFSNTFGVFGLPHGGPKATKIAPRRVLDCLGSFFFDSRFSL